MRRSLLIAVASVSVFFAVPSSAEANGDTVCVGVVTGVHDNVVVPEGAFCELTGATVLGNVKALKDSTLLMNSDTVHGNVVGVGARQVGGTVTVGGNFEGIDTETVECDRCTIGGNFVAKGGVVDNLGFDARIGPSTTVYGDVQYEKVVGDVTVFASSVPNGNVQLTENFIAATDPSPPSPFEGLNVISSFIGGDLQVIKNRGPGPKHVVNNTAGESIQCFENDPPFVGGPNTAPKKEGQCF